MAVRRRYSPRNISRSDAVRTGSGARRSGSGSGSPLCRRTVASSSDKVRSASSSRPCTTSQRGDSGSFRRPNHTMIAPTAPRTSSSRHPASPNTVVEATVRLPTNATSGTARKPNVYAQAMYRPRTRLGRNSAR